uniref:FBD domain-containing protein n=2 Tax=Lotus japonicus TaxID=34305 RepID=I3S460_LOTJA|nr:unknown [Lotus japonicus]
MHYVQFINPQFLMNLLYGCPVLEDLEILHVYFDDSDLGSNDTSFNDSPFEGQVKSLSNLVRAKVFFHLAFHIPVKAFSNAQFLHLNKCDAGIPVFPNLTYLEISFKRHSLKWNLVLDMLNHCPKLQTVVFDIRLDDDEVWPDPGFIPKCFSTHLRKCFIKGYAGVDCQMRFARYVLQNATLLRSLIICSRYSQNHQRKLEMITELASYPRSSAVCELLFK